MTKSYAGIGARSTPDSALHQMLMGAIQLKEAGYMLRSGHADGADQAFERGADGFARIYLPWPAYNQETPIKGNGVVPDMDKLFDEAMFHHPNWDNLSQGAKKLMARNVAIILGSSLKDPVDMVICWTPKGEAVGGTGHALRVAKHHGVPIYNLYFQSSVEKLSELLWPS